jgi:hypothetical protein
VTKGGGELDRSKVNIRATNMKNGKEVSEIPFYCDACIETENEALIPADLTSARAEDRRAVLRRSAADRRGKATMFRACYIALKVTSVPCHNNGSLSSRYTPRREHHAFDTALPQSGENMFGDVDSNPSAQTEVIAKSRAKIKALFNDKVSEPTAQSDTIAASRTKIETLFGITDEGRREDVVRVLKQINGAMNNLQTTLPNKTTSTTPRQKAPPFGKSAQGPPKQTIILNQRLSNGDKNNSNATPQPTRTRRYATRSSTLSLDEQVEDQIVASRKGKRRRDLDNYGDEDEDDEDEQPVRLAKRKKAVPVVRKAMLQRGKKKA